MASRLNKDAVSKNNKLNKLANKIGYNIKNNDCDRDTIKIVGIMRMKLKEIRRSVDISKRITKSARIQYIKSAKDKSKTIREHMRRRRCSVRESLKKQKKEMDRRIERIITKKRVYLQSNFR